jgi:hypothetical protein
MPFQKQVNTYQAPANLGAIASMNPLSTVAAGPGGLVAGAAGVLVGRFAWNTYPVAGGPGLAQNMCPISDTEAPRVPDGFICNQQQGLITLWLGSESLGVPHGVMVTEHDRGDFWAQSTMSEAIIGNKVFANLITGQALAAAAGSTPASYSGTPAVIKGTVASLTNFTMTITEVTSGVVAPGQLVVGENIPQGTYISSLGTSTGGTGTVFLTRNATKLFTAQDLTTSVPEAYGAFDGTASFATDVMTVTAVQSGAAVAGQLVTSANVAAGTYIVAQLTGTPGGAGTYQLSTEPGTITAQDVKATSWIETDWYVKSAGNVMDLIKIGLK